MFPSYLNGPTGMMPGQYTSNPYLDRLNAMQGGTQQMQAAPQQIIHVNGEGGARAFRMAPNSQCLLLDDTAPIVWLATTDGAGYPSLTPYTITPYQAAPAPDPANMDERLRKLEALIYGKPDSASPAAAGPVPGPSTGTSSVPLGNDAAFSGISPADGR